EPAEPTGTVAALGRRAYRPEGRDAPQTGRVGFGRRPFQGEHHEEVPAGPRRRRRSDLVRAPDLRRGGQAGRRGWREEGQEGEEGEEGEEGGRGGSGQVSSFFISSIQTPGPKPGGLFLPPPRPRPRARARARQRPRPRPRALQPRRRTPTLVEHVR